MASNLEVKTQRIAANVAAALAKIAEKGVAVADTANSDDLAELIDAIETGSGGTPILCNVTIKLRYNITGSIYVPVVKYIAFINPAGEYVCEEFKTVTSSNPNPNGDYSFTVNAGAMIAINALTDPSITGDATFYAGYSTLPGAVVPSGDAVISY